MTAESTYDHLAPANTVTSVFVTTPGQQRFWFLDRLAPDNARVNMALAFRLRGRLDVFALLEAIRLLQMRHEVLRTTFHTQEGKLVQRVHDQLDSGLSMLDLSSLPKDQREDEAARLRHEFARVRLDLEVGPPISFRAVRLTAEEHVLMVTLSHLVCDGWSNGILLRDLCELYGAAVERRSAILPELPVQYADYAECCQEWLEQGGHRAGLQTICDSIKVPEGPLALPLDFERGTAFPGGEISTLLLTPYTVERLREFCRTEEVTNFEVMLAAFEIFLARFTGGEQFLISTLAANRSQPEVKDLIGLFANPQIIAATIDGGETGRDVLQRVCKWSREAQDHQQVPFEVVLDELQRSRVQMTLETCFLYQKAFMQPFESGGLRFEPIRSVSPGAIYPLGLNVVERLEGPRLQMEYDSALFLPETIQHVLSGYAAILDQILGCPDLPIHEFPLSLALATRKLVRSSGPVAAVSPEPLAVRAERHFTRSHVSDAIEDRMTELWERVLKIPAIHPTASVKELGASSLAIVRLLAEIWREFEISFPITVFLESPTIRSLSERVRLAKDAPAPLNLPDAAAGFVGPEPEQTVVRLAQGAAGSPIFCIYGIYLYGPFATKFAGERTVYGAYQRMELQLLERGVWSDELTVLTRVETLAALYLEEIEKVQPEGPYYLVGESFGGFVAYEMAQQLRRKGKRVELVAILDIPAPGYQRAKPLLKRLAVHASRLRKEGWPYFCARFASPLERLKDRLAALRYGRRVKVNAEPSSDEVSERARRTLRRSVRAQAMRNYRPQPYPGRLVLVRAMDTDEFVDTNRDREWGWSKFAQGGVDVIDVPGDHLGILAEPNVCVLANELRGRMPRRPTDNLSGIAVPRAS
jgi:thioesterase domain-containing protein/acyl carrier protein